MNRRHTGWGFIVVLLLFRTVAAPAVAADATALPPLVTTTALQEMTAAQVAPHPRFRIEGVVTVSDSRARDFFIEDETGGIYCDVGRIGTLPPLGTRLVATGQVSEGGFRPIFIAESLSILGQAPLPGPRPASHKDLWAGKYDGDRVRVSGQALKPRFESIPERRWIIPLLAEDLQLQVLIPFSELPQAEVNDLVGTYLTVDGVAGVDASETGQPKTVYVNPSRRKYFNIATNQAGMAAQAPVQTLATLLDAAHFARPAFIRTSGRVCLTQEGVAFIAEPGGGIRIHDYQGPPLKAGDWIDVYGITAGYRPERRLQFVSLVARRPGNPEPVTEVEAGDLFRIANLGRRLTIKAEFLHRMPRGPGDSLVLQRGSHTFEARLAFDHSPAASELHAGSTVQATGILWYFDNANPDVPVQPRLLVARPEDFAVISRPPWPMHITLTIVSVLAGALTLGLLALIVTHQRLKNFSRRIEQRDEELRTLNTQLEARIHERTAELERTNHELSREAAERNKAQAALLDRESRLRTLIESVTAVMWECDLASNSFTYVSPQAAEFGFPLEEWLKPGFWQAHIHPDDRQEAVDFCFSQTEKGLAHEFEYRFTNAAGEYVWVHDKVTVHAEEGRPRLLRGVLFNIDEKRQREAALRESEERFVKAFQANPASVAITSFPDGTIIDVNQSLLDLSGYRREELIGRTSDELHAWPNPEQRREVIRRLQQGRTARDMEVVIAGKDRRPLTMISSFERIILGGRPCILSINQNITERKLAETALRESEERFAKAFHSSPVITVITRQADARYVDVNEQFTRTLGYSREETLGKTSLELGIWVNPAQRQNIADTLEGGGEIRDWECEFRDRNGSRHTMLLSIERINLRGEPCLLGINHDITARKLAERLRDEQNAVLEMIAQGAPLGSTLDRLVLAIESQARGTRCSILLFDKENKRLLHGAAPRMPEEYNRAIHGLAIGPKVGSCGSAAFTREQVTVEDIETDARWNDYRELARRAGIRACWSTPIFDSHRQLLGTFAVYYSEARRPDPHTLGILATAAHTAAICIKSAADDAALRETARTLRHQNELLQFMGRLAQVGAWSLDVESQTLTWSEQTYAIHELDPSTRLDVATAINFYAPEARPTISAAVEAALKDGTSWDLELPFVTAKGRWKWVRTQGQAELHEGRVIRLSGAFQDITHRKQTEQALRASEERFQLAMRGANDGLWDWNLRTNECYYSPRWKAMLGYADEELPAQLDTWKNLTTADDVQRVLLEVEAVLQGVDETFQSEFRMHHKDGRTVHILSRAFLVRDASGSAERFVGTHVDITERKHSEELRRQLEHQLQQSQKMETIGTLAGGVAHDFNNLLGAIIGCAELARMDCSGNLPAIENLNDLLNASHRAKELVRQILTFSRQQPQERHPMPVKPVLEESIRLLRAALPASVALRARLAPHTPLVLADAGLLQQVIMNLVTNAAQAIGGRPGEVEISLDTAEPDATLRAQHPALRPGPHVLLQVRDNGAGMDEAVLRRIFDPFFTTKGPGHGTGLGLSVVHGIVRSHEGFIHVESQPGTGSTFSIYLPVAEAAAGPRAPFTKPAGLPTGHERILLVDDELALLKVEEKILRNAGYNVTACSQPAEALEIFRQSPFAFSLVITDYAMPGQTGDMLARELLAIRPGVPILICTGYTSNLTREQAHRIGFRDLIQKPAEIDQICRAVRQAIDSPAPSRQP